MLINAEKFDLLPYWEIRSKWIFYASQIYHDTEKYCDIGGAVLHSRTSITIMASSAEMVDGPMVLNPWAATQN